MLRERFFPRLGLAALVAVAGVASFEGMLRLGVVPNRLHEKIEAERFWEDADHRITILGDSFIMPRGGLAPLLVEELAAHDTAVHNLAVSGTGPFEYLARLKGSRKEPRPDLVLLTYYAGNDLTDVSDNPRFKPGRPGTAIRLDLPPEELPTGERWYQHLYLDDFLRSPFRPPRHVFDWEKFRRAGIAPDLIDEAQAGRMNPWLMELSARNENHLLDNVLMETEENMEGWKVGSELIRRMHAGCRERRAKLVIVVFPRSIQVNDTHFEFFEKLTFRVDARTLESARPQTLMAELCAPLGIPVLDLLPVFKARADEELYLVHDDHLNVEGNRLAAREIVPFLLEHL